MPNLFSSLSECFGFSQIIKSLLLRVSIARFDMSFKFPIGVATINISKFALVISIIILFILSCTPLKSPKQSEQPKKIYQDKQKTELIKESNENIKTNKVNSKKEIAKINNIKINKDITILFSNEDKNEISKQFINVIELGVYNKSLENVSFNVKFFNNESELEQIITKSKKSGKIFIGPTEIKYTKLANKFCKDEVIFFSFSSDTSLAKNCVYLLNFFPRNELEQLFLSLTPNSKVALLYPENKYGYNINKLIDDVIDTSDVVLVNRASYKNDLSNVRDAIKELGKYELRKYELERQKNILSKKNDEKSKKRLKKLQKFKTTNDYDFTHILIADYGLNLLQVAPLLAFYDIDPKVVQFLSTGVIDDDNFFYEPSLQGTIFPGIEKTRRVKLLKQYREIYDENLLRISTLPYDLVGLLNYVFSKNLTYQQMIEFLNSSEIKFDGVDGEFYFKDNLIERDLDILKIFNGNASKIN